MLRHFAFLALACGCNPQNPQDACDDIVHAYCQRIFDVANQGCTQASDFMSSQGFSSLNDCTTAMSAIVTMNGHTCAAMPTNGCAPDDFSGDRAGSCNGDMGKLDCTYDWARGPIPAAPECENICCVHQGNPGSGMECCSGTSHVETTGCGLGGTEICD